MSSKKIEQFVKETHKRCVKFAFSNAASNADFYSEHDLSCMCSVASYYLMSRMASHSDLNIKHVRFIEGTFDDMNLGKKRVGDWINHSWITFKGDIIDLTLAQFVKGKNPFILTKKDKLFKRFYPRKEFTYFQLDELKKSLKGWSREQSPLTWTPLKIDRVIDKL